MGWRGIGGLTGRRSISRREGLTVVHLGDLSGEPRLGSAFLQKKKKKILTFILHFPPVDNSPVSSACVPKAFLDINFTGYVRKSAFIPQVLFRYTVMRGLCISTLLYLQYSKKITWRPNEVGEFGVFFG